MEGRHAFDGRNTTTTITTTITTITTITAITAITTITMYHYMNQCRRWTNLEETEQREREMDTSQRETCTHTLLPIDRQIDRRIQIARGTAISVCMHTHACVHTHTHTPTHPPHTHH